MCPLGKDKILHVTKDDLAKPEVIDTLLVDTGKYGILLPNGEINWDCPCLGGMPHGPCGQEFKDAFSCFHYRLERGWSGHETFVQTNDACNLKGLLFLK